MKRVAVAALLLAASSNSSSLEVKGIEIGGPTSEQDLAQLFGEVQCDYESLGFACKFKMTYLGIPATAKVMIVGKRADYMSIDLPNNRIRQVEEALVSRYGSPRSRIGDIISFQKSDQSVGSYITECTSWNNVQGARVEICLQSEFSGSAIRYWAVEEEALDSDDI